MTLVDACNTDDPPYEHLKSFSSKVSKYQQRVGLLKIAEEN